METADAPTNPRFCVNCRWCDHAAALYECMAPQNFTERQSPVTGAAERLPKAKYCETQRSTSLDDRCGIAGRWFEEREEEIRDAAE